MCILNFDGICDRKGNRALMEGFFNIEKWRDKLNGETHKKLNQAAHKNTKFPKSLLLS